MQDPVPIGYIYIQYLDPIFTRILIRNAAYKAPLGFVPFFSRWGLFFLKIFCLFFFLQTN